MNIARIVKATHLDDEALTLLREYFDAVGVHQRDDTEFLQEILREPSSGLWLAMLGEEAVGCIMLRPLAALRRSGECKRLYVRPLARRRGIAEALLTALEQHASAVGLDWIYLDSKDDLLGALRLYRKQHYEPCPRYNENTQATIFLRKRVAGATATEQQ